MIAPIKYQKSMSYQHRYAQFARVRGFTEGNEPLMHEFITWVKAKWAKWRIATGHQRGYLTREDHAAFDAWLEKETT